MQFPYPELASFLATGNKWVDQLRGREVLRHDLGSNYLGPTAGPHCIERMGYGSVHGYIHRQTVPLVAACTV